MGEVFYIPVAMPLVLLFGGLAAIFAFLAVLLIKKPSLPLPRLFFPPLRVYRKITIAVLVFTAVLMVVFLTFHLVVYVSVSDGRVDISIPSVLTWRTFVKDDIAGVSIKDWRQESGFRPVLRIGGTSLENYNVGWFKLANGKTALLLSLSPVNLVVETRDGYYVLLSPPNFDSFVEVFERLILPVEG